MLTIFHKMALEAELWGDKTSGQAWDPGNPHLMILSDFRIGPGRAKRLKGEGPKAMTDKELHKLSRRELLEMLLEQAKEAERLTGLLTETERELHQMEETYERLRDRLDKKDLQIKTLKATLEEERHKREIELREAGSIAEAALRLNGVFEAAQRAADQYLEGIREMYPPPGGPPDGGARKRGREP